MYLLSVDLLGTEVKRVERISDDKSRIRRKIKDFVPYHSNHSFVDSWYTMSANYKSSVTKIINYVEN